MGSQIWTAPGESCISCGTATFVGEPVVDATSSLKGVIRLGGDLGGTAQNPTVPGLASKLNVTDPHVVGTLYVNNVAVNLDRDEIQEFTNLASFPFSGQASMIYVDLTEDKTYRWTGSQYREVSPSDVNSVNGRKGIVTGLAEAVHTHTATGISDSTAIGRALIRAATQAEARDAIGAGTGSGSGGTDASALTTGTLDPARIAAGTLTAAKLNFAPATSGDLTTAIATRAPTSHQHAAVDISDSTTVGRALVTAATVATQRTALGGTTTGIALFTATDVPAARSTMLLNTYTAFWTGSAWPSLPTLPAGTVVYWDSALDPAATAPPGITSGRWIKAD